MIELQDSERQRCEIWSRVMGYHRPISDWNAGKQCEHKDRTFFLETHMGKGYPIPSGPKQPKTPGKGKGKKGC